MLLRRNVSPKTLMSLGMMALAIGNVAPWILGRRHLMSEDLLDGVRGLLMGIAIATLLLGVWLRGRRA